jgi:hypothetical protein
MGFLSRKLEAVFFRQVIDQLSCSDCDLLYDLSLAP